MFLKILVVIYSIEFLLKSGIELMSNYTYVCICSSLHDKTFENIVFSLC